MNYKMRSAHSGPLGPAAHHPGVKETSVPMTGAERAATWWHQGAAGGGAMLDYCGYGAMTSRWYIGESAVDTLGMKVNLNSQWGDADDNAVLIIRYPSAIAVIEASWTTRHPGITSGPIIYGTDGTLVLDSTKELPALRIEKPGEESKTISIDPLPEGRANVAEEMIHHLDTGEPLHFSISVDFNIEVAAILDAGVRSAETGEVQSIENL